MTVVLAAEQRTVVRDLRGRRIGWGREGLAWRVVVVKIEEESRRMDMDDGLIESNGSKMCVSLNFRVYQHTTRLLENNEEMDW